MLCFRSPIESRSVMTLAGRNRKTRELSELYYQFGLNHFFLYRFFLFFVFLVFSSFFLSFAAA